MTDKPPLRIGLIGSGFMGRAHAFGYATAAQAFDLPYRVELRTLADITERPRRGTPPRWALRVQPATGATSSPTRTSTW